MDYCPAANWGNWAHAAGVGATPGLPLFLTSRSKPETTPKPEVHQAVGTRFFQGPPLVDPRKSLLAAEQRCVPNISIRSHVNGQSAFCELISR